MKILLTGANGYIGRRLLIQLLSKNHEVVCAVRDKKRFSAEKEILSRISIIELDTLKPETLKNIPNEIDGAYYLIHSMSYSSDEFDKMEEDSAHNFRQAMENTNVKHVVYLSGIVNEEKLSKHLSSRKKVEEILSQGKYNFTTLRAGIIIGSGSASFEIIRDLVEKLPMMITPRWVLTKSQPIAIRDVIMFLSKTLFKEETYNKNYDIGGPDILTYKDMLLKFGEIRKLRRWIISVPIMTPRLSSYWLYFVTSTSYKLAVNLVNSMKVEVVCRPNNLGTLLEIEPLTYEEAIKKAFEKIEQNEIISSWKDSFVSSKFNINIDHFIRVPDYGCYKDKRIQKVKDEHQTLDKIWSIGGEKGWYYANWIWRLRGFTDKVFGGVGLRRGRTNADKIEAGDTLDFWRVLYANKENGRLLLYAEMRLPGEAWLEFNIKNQQLIQTATFRPKGLWGRFYWYLLTPFHFFIFRNMAKRIAR